MNSTWTSNSLDRAAGGTHFIVTIRILNIVTDMAEK
jgi:hypothetical protein